MPAEKRQVVLYWDASAVLSALVEDVHTTSARRRLRDRGQHLLSSLACAEVVAVLSRLGREGTFPRGSTDTASESLQRGPWRWLAAVPTAQDCARLAARHPLRGADLWHLALAVSMRDELPELRLLTFDAALARAAEEEGVGAA
jgi:predicted nucleic acid-binding protein